jgi:hypothetical protein
MHQASEHQEITENSFEHVALVHHSFASNCSKIMHMISLCEVLDTLLDDFGGMEEVGS